MNDFTSLIIGISSSLIATALFVGLAELTRRVLLPWYADNIYRGVRIDGKWELCRLGNEELSPGECYTSVFQIKQKADRITGIAILSDSKESEGTCYNITGRIRDGYFSATAWPANNDMVDAMACLFRVFHLDGALRLKGRIVFLKHANAAIEASDKDLEYKKVS